MTELLRHVEPGVRSWPRRLRGASPLSTQAAGWYVGAAGEQRTGRALAGLPTALLLVADRPATWHRAAPPLGPADLLQERFRQLQREVRSAGRTRAVWRVSVAAGALASIGVVGPDVPQAVTEAVLTAR